MYPEMVFLQMPPYDSNFDQAVSTIFSNHGMIWLVEEGLVCAAEAYCSQCAECVCEEHRRAHSKTPVTNKHKVTHVRDLLLTDEVVNMEEVPMVLEVAPVRRFTLVKKRKITDLI